MSDPIFERYKEALKHGHVAVLRGQLDEALAHYEAASGIADDRALPHASAGGVLLRLGRAEEAVGAYERALARSPEDEAALRGRADALAAAGRTEDARAALEALAAVQTKTGRQADALATLREALGHRETERLRASYVALAEELGVPVDPLAVAPPRGDGGETDDDASFEAVADEVPGDDREGGAVPAAATPSAPDPAPHLAAAESLLVGGDRASAATELVAAAEAYAHLDLIDAALDAANQALRVAPDLPEVHLGLARLYFRRGWRERATDTLLLLDRFLEIEPHPGARVALADLARQHLSADPRLEPLTRGDSPPTNVAGA